MKKQHRENQQAARAQILAAATKHRQKRQARDGRFLLKPFTAANLNEAVCVCRRNLLVSDDVLSAAGFNPARRPARSERKAA